MGAANPSNFYEFLKVDRGRPSSHTSYDQEPQKAVRIDLLPGRSVMRLRRMEHLLVRMSAVVVPLGALILAFGHF